MSHCEAWGPPAVPRQMPTVRYGCPTILCSLSMGLRLREPQTTSFTQIWQLWVVFGIDQFWGTVSSNSLPICRPQISIHWLFYPFIQDLKALWSWLSLRDWDGTLAGCVLWKCRDFLRIKICPCYPILNPEPKIHPSSSTISPQVQGPNCTHVRDIIKGTEETAS